MKVLTNYEYDNLASCIMADPHSVMTFNNELQIDTELAHRQFEVLVKTMKNNGVKIYFLEDQGGASQVFTRDIGFIIDDVFFIANMTQPERQTEINPLLDFTRAQDIKVHIMKNKAEGGDILVHQNKIFVGLGYRTTPEAVQEISQVLTSHNKFYEFIPVSFNTSRIHLDCVFNILAGDTCIVTEDIINPDEVIGHFAKHIEAPLAEQPYLPTNIVDLGKNMILCSSEVFCGVLAKEGYKPTYINFSEILKVNGGMGCCVLPLLRVP